MSSSFHAVVAHVSKALTDGLIYPQRADGADEGGEGEERGLAGQPFSVQLSILMGKDASRNNTLVHLNRATGGRLRVAVEEVSQ